MNCLQAEQNHIFHFVFSQSCTSLPVCLCTIGISLVRSLNQPSWNWWLAHVVGDEASQALTLNRTTELWLTNETGQQGHTVQYELCSEVLLDSVHGVAQPTVIVCFLFLTHVYPWHFCTAVSCYLLIACKIQQCIFVYICECPALLLVLGYHQVSVCGLLFRCY